jgi:hypothetical protein
MLSLLQRRGSRNLTKLAGYTRYDITRERGMADLFGIRLRVKVQIVGSGRVNEEKEIQGSGYESTARSYIKVDGVPGLL